MQTIIITVLATIYVIGVLAFGAGACIAHSDGTNTSPLTVAGEVLFVIFWPITIPGYFFLTKGKS